MTTQPRDGQELAPCLHGVAYPHQCQPCNESAWHKELRANGQPLNQCLPENHEWITCQHDPRGQSCWHCFATRRTP